MVSFIKGRELSGPVWKKKLPLINFWGNILWTNEAKVKLFEMCVSRYMLHKANTAVWGCFAASGPGRLSIIEETMISTQCQKILKQNVQPSACDLKLKCTRNSPKKLNLTFQAAQPKSRLKSDWDAVTWPWTVRSSLKTFLAELYQFCKTELKKMKYTLTVITNA